MSYIMLNIKCPKCKNFLYFGSCTVKGYDGTCLNCDEDFYLCEVTE